MTRKAQRRTPLPILVAVCNMVDAELQLAPLRAFYTDREKYKRDYARLWARRKVSREALSRARAGDRE